jgi:hypothetical protein
LVERRKSVLAFRIVRSPVHEHANPPQTFRLLPRAASGQAAAVPPSSVMN